MQIGREHRRRRAAPGPGPRVPRAGRGARVQVHALHGRLGVLQIGQAAPLRQRRPAVQRRILRHGAGAAEGRPGVAVRDVEGRDAGAREGLGGVEELQPRGQVAEVAVEVVGRVAGQHDLGEEGRLLLLVHHVDVLDGGGGHVVDVGDDGEAELVRNLQRGRARLPLERGGGVWVREICVQKMARQDSPNGELRG